MKKKILLIISIIITMSICSGCGLLTQKDKTTDISDYSEYLGTEGKHPNDIFPQSIPISAVIEDFCYYYYNSWDPNHVVYLVYSCNEEDYAKETERLSKLNSSSDYLIYGGTGFNYPICAILADSYNGYIYALADKDNNRLIYVEITFCDYFSDINYEEIIDKEYLLKGFDAKLGNSTRRAFEKGELNK
ncbi:hypothetical protein [Desulfosporosinus nitroreducens]|uniref:Lipoprotein n=1 Tax=Desulfosporosinus nitroreducens TaxID=2018668 RepID=A0ABT8QTH2_9FIRM|nr:hypothetical protein [Desulfosporosinus nitroreducens]MDO0824132.1 hypothetical protein [Desulfosporosinus nitroreducens]